MSMTMFPKKAVVAATVLIEMMLFDTAGAIEPLDDRNPEEVQFVAEAGPGRNKLTFASYNTSFEVAMMDFNKKPGLKCVDCIRASEALKPPYAFIKHPDKPYGDGGNFCTRNVLAILLQHIQLGTAFISCPEDSTLLAHIFATKEGQLHPGPGAGGDWDSETAPPETLSAEKEGVLVPAQHPGVRACLDRLLAEQKERLEGKSEASAEKIRAKFLDLFEGEFLNRGAALKYELDLQKLSDQMKKYASTQGLYISQMWNTDVLEFDAYLTGGPKDAQTYDGHRFADPTKASKSDADQISHYLGHSDPRPVIATLFKVKNFDQIKSSKGSLRSPTLLTFAVHGPHLKGEDHQGVVNRFGKVFDWSKLSKDLYFKDVDNSRPVDFVLLQGDLNKTMPGPSTRWSIPVPQPDGSGGASEDVPLFKPDPDQVVPSTYPGFTHEPPCLAGLASEDLAEHLRTDEFEDTDNNSHWKPDNVFFGASSRAEKNFTHQIRSHTVHTEGVASDHLPIVSILEVAPKDQKLGFPPMRLHKVYGPHSSPRTREDDAIAKEAAAHLAAAEAAAKAAAEETAPASGRAAPASGRAAAAESITV